MCLNRLVAVGCAWCREVGIKHQGALEIPAAACVADVDMGETTKPVGMIADFSQEFCQVCHTIGHEFLDYSSPHGYTDMNIIPEVQRLDSRGM